jgi:hypothetical protein
VIASALGREIVTDAAEANCNIGLTIAMIGDGAFKPAQLR